MVIYSYVAGGYISHVGFSREALRVSTCDNIDDAVVFSEPLAVFLKSVLNDAHLDCQVEFV